MQIKLKHTMRFKSNEHFHENTLTSQNDARQTLATVLRTMLTGQYFNK